MYERLGGRRADVSPIPKHGAGAGGVFADMSARTVLVNVNKSCDCSPSLRRAVKVTEYTPACVLMKPRSL